MLSTNPSSFLLFNDLKMQIQTNDLLQILQTCDCNVGCISEWTDLTQYSQNVLIQSERESIEEISSYIRGRYLTNEVFAPTQLWTSGQTYFGKNLVYYNKPSYTASTAYNIGDQFSYKGIVYSANTYMSGSTNPLTGATYITENDAIYHANLPTQEWSANATYQKGNLVWYQDNIYQAKATIRGITPATSQNLELRYGIPSAQMYLGYYTIDFDLQPNPLPSVNTNNWMLYSGAVSSWFTGQTYYFSGANPTQNTPYWSKGDTRNPQIVMYAIDILLYHLLSRISPNQIPDLRSIRYDGNTPAQLGGAIGWLKRVQSGKVSLNLPEIQPVQGGAIRYGSYPKNNNSF